MKNKILLYDIEIMHDYDESYQRRMYSGFIDVGVRMSADISRISHFGYKWLGEERAYCKDLTDFPGFGKKESNEKELLKFASELFAKADHLVAHYGNKFDRKYINAKLLKYRLPPIPPTPQLKQTDTCLVARNHLKLSSNRLDNIAQFLGVEMKRSKNWPGDWLKMTQGDKAAFKRVKYYCIGDIISLEAVAKILWPFASGIPNHSLLIGGAGCTHCGSKNFIKYGFAYGAKKRFQRFQCKDCATSFHEGQIIK